MRLYLIGVANPLNIGILLTSIVAGLLAAWWLFPVGVVLWIVMVLTIARDPSLRISQTMQTRNPLAPRFQKYFDRLARSQVGVFNAIASSSSPAVRRALQPVQVEVNRLADQVYRLSNRMTSLENYRLVSQAGDDLESDLKHIKELIANTTDPISLREYEQSQRALESRMANLEAVSRILERVEAQLLSLSNEMDGLLTEIVRMQASGVDHVSQRVPALVQFIRQQIEELKTFEREAAQL